MLNISARNFTLVELFLSFLANYLLSDRLEKVSYTGAKILYIILYYFILFYYHYFSDWVSANSKES